VTKPPSTAARQSRPAVRPLAAVSVVVAGLALGGCSFIAPETSLEPYAPSDGLQVDLGDVLVRNVLVVSEGSGAPGVLSGALVNRGVQDATITVEASDLITEVDVAAGQTVFMSSYDSSTVSSGDDVQVVLEAVDTPAGGVLEVTFTDPAAESESFEVPVLLPEGPYAGLLPSVEASGEPFGGSITEPSTDASAEPTAGASTEPTAEPSGVATSDPSTVATTGAGSDG